MIRLKRTLPRLVSSWEYQRKLPGAAISAIISLMALAIGIGTGAQLHRPLAVAFIGGFIGAMPLLLIVLPTMLRLLYRKKT